MTRRVIASLVCSTALAAGLAVPAVAQDKRAVVIADSPAERDRAVAISETLLGLGFDVRRLEAPAAGDIDAALARLDATDGTTAVYHAGMVPDVADYIGAGATMPRFVFLDSCADLDLSDIPENTFVAANGSACDTDLSQVLLERLTVPGLRTDQWDLSEDLQAVSTLDMPYVFRTASSDVRLTADDYAMLDTLSPAARDLMIDLWRDAGIPVDIATDRAQPAAAAPETVRLSPVRPVAPAAVVRPVTPVLTGGVSPVRDNVSVVARPLTAPSTAPAATTSGRPAPSILVGYVIENLPDAPQVPDEPVAGNAFGVDDVTAREALRAQDAALFGGLVESGAFDPPQDQIARALQVELARINCYTAGIDGAWGAGSQRALLAFYEEIGEVPPGSAADLESFREVIARDDVRCPEPPPPPVAQPVAQQRQPQPSAPAQSSRVAPAPPPAPAPAAPASPRRSISQTSGTGVFR